MIKIFITFFCIFISSNVYANENLNFYVGKAIKNNLKLNAERKKSRVSQTI